MRQKRTIPFKITGIDGLGQGVSKLTDKVTFIPKTLPEEEGEAQLMSEKKGVAFARLVELTKKSESRINPACPHFNTCPSCHFLHMSYEDEIRTKQETFQKLFRNFSLPSLQVIPADRRSGYRNRVQLHYSLKSKLLGMRDPQTFEITPIPECIIALPQVGSEIKRLYANNAWMKEAPSAPMEGHVEIYWFHDHLQTSWNQAYADGGFTQVFDQMNEKLKNVLKSHWSADQSFELLDLFAGNGNLSSALPFSKRLCVDFYPQPRGEEFLHQNLYAKMALEEVQNRLKARSLKPTYLLLDPPRSGLKNLDQWLKTILPRKVAYVSCDPHTMARDLASVADYQMGEAFLIDFFPSTFHFESLIFLERKD